MSIGESLRVGVLLCGLLSAAVRAEPVASESFNYDSGSQLAGVGTSENGWTGAWTNGMGGGLSLSGEAKSLWFGNSMSFNVDGTGAVESSGSQSSFRHFTPVPLTSQTLWFTALVRVDGGTGNHARFEMRDAAGNVRFIAGLADDPADADSIPNLFVDAIAGTTGGYDGAVFGSNAGYSTNWLLVVKRESSGISAALLPGDGAAPAEPQSWDVTNAGLSGVSLQKLTIAVSTPTLWIDEIRIATTFADATAGLSLEAVEPTLSVASSFSDHMVLQRDQPVPVWGTAEAGTEITVEFAGQTKTTTADSSNHWKIVLAPMTASSNPRVLQVSSSEFQVSFSDVLVGDVWLCSGQSNMVFPLYSTKDWAAESQNGDHPLIRLYRTTMASTNIPLEEVGGSWAACTSSSAGPFSGVAYYFGKKIHEELGVPVGLLQSAYPGSAIQAWTPPDGVHYNAMVHAHIPFAMRGVIWYQGEANANAGMAYVDLTDDLLKAWRGLWGTDFPFYYVQLAPYAPVDATDPYRQPTFWEAQAAIEQNISNTWMAVINDSVTTNEVIDIHPPNKQIPGTRLALLALDHSYGQDVVSSGPVVSSIEQKPGRIEVSFDCADGLTTCDGNPPDWFEVAGANGAFVSADATISSNKVILTSSEISDPLKMRFAWYMGAMPNLVNDAGLPASAFRSEVTYAASESFDYFDETMLTGGTANGGAEWVDGWNAVSGGGLRILNGRIDQESAAGSTRGFVNPLSLDGPGDFYVSFFAKTDADGAFSFNLKQSSGDYVRWAFTRNADGSITLNGGGATKTSAAGLFAADTEYFVVSRFVTSNDTASVVLFETSSPGNYTNEPAVWDLSATGATGVAIDRLDIDVSGGHVMLDDISTGTAYEDVIRVMASEVPVLQTPADASSSPYAFPNFSWTEHRKQFLEVGAPVNYEVQIATDADFLSIVDEDCVGLSRYVHDQPFEPGTYYWRVRSVTDEGRTSVWSAVSSFDVAPADEMVTVSFDPGASDHEMAVLDAVEMVADLAGQGRSVKLVFPAGHYYFNDPAMDTLISLPAVTNVAVEGNGAHLHFASRKQSLISSEGSARVSISGFKVSYAKGVLRIQGTVTAVDSASATVTLFIEPGYPDFSASDDPVGDIFLLLDPVVDGRQKTGSLSFYRMVSGGYSQNPDETWNVVLDRTSIPEWEVGDRFVYHFRAGSPVLTRFSESSEVTLHDLEIGGWGNMMVGSTHGSFINLLDVDTFFESGKWMIGNADGVHLRGNTVGPWIEGTRIQANGDDGIALYARPASMVSAKPDEVQNAAVFRDDHFNLEAGDDVAFFEPLAGIILLETLVETVTSLGDGTWLVCFVNDLPDGMNFDGNLVDITQVWNRSKSCGDFMIRNGKMTNNRRYATVQRARRGIIENMEYSGASSSSIKFINEPQWPNGLYASEIIIRNNLIQDSGFVSGNAPPLAFSFSGYGTSAQSIGPRNLLIENNTFNDCGPTEIYMNDTRNAVVRNNRVAAGNGLFESATCSSPDSERITVYNDNVSGDSTPPSAPDGLTADQSAGTVSLSWLRGSEPDLAGYRIYRSVTNYSFSLLASNVLTSSYDDETAEAGVIYHYVVTAVDLSGNESAASESVVIPDNLSVNMLYPVADLFVQGGLYAEANFGREGTLHCKTVVGSEELTRRVFLRFDLSSVSGAVEAATLRLKLSSMTGSGGDVHTAYAVADDNWDETAVIWSNQPVTGALLDSGNMPSPGGWLELDVTGQVQSELSGDRLFSVALLSAGDTLAVYHSREASAADSPQLVLQGDQFGSYDGWALQYGLEFGPSGYDDADGFNNFYEYGMGGDPTDPLDTGFPVQFAVAGDDALYIHPRLSVDSGICYRLELTDDLVSNVWKTNGYVVAGVRNNGFAAGLDAVTNRILMDGAEAQFVRLIIEEL